jgi:hypothetical protein
MSASGMEAAALASALARWSDAERLSALKRIVPKRVVTRVLRQTGKDRSYCKRLPAWFMAWFVIGIGLFCGDCYRQVYRWLMRWSKDRPVPGRSTICEARQRLGARPVALLYRRVAGLLGEPSRTPAAFYRGMRLMALDGFTLDLPDTPANRRAFGGPSTGRANGAFPQARVLALCEAGTHVLWRALVKHYRCGEITMTPYLLKELRPGMLLLWDRNFFKYDHVKAVLASGAHLLAPAKDHMVLRPTRRLRDGSYLAKVYRHTSDRERDRNGIVVRVIKYTLADPNRPGHREERRLLTTLLDERLDPARDLVELYHVRWEEELAIDELKTHEMERPVLRSQTPAGVIQEVYGLLLAHYVVRALMCEAADKANRRAQDAEDAQDAQHAQHAQDAQDAQHAQEPITPLRLSFTGTLKILRCRLPEFPHRGARTQRRWWQDLLDEVGRETIEPRRNRTNPRVIKRKMSNWKKKRPEHLDYPQPTKEFRDCIVIQR